MTEVECRLDDPSARLVAAYREIYRTRMEDLPFVNRALEVEAVAFAPWSGCWLGVMVTPWSMNLMLLPHDVAQWHRGARGGKRAYAFPAGRYEFIAGEDPVIGEYQSCSLFSPVLQFVDQDTARLVARLARDALMDRANADALDDTQAEASLGDTTRPLATLEATLDKPISKRDFLRGRFLEDDGARGFKRTKIDADRG